MRHRKADLTAWEWLHQVGHQTLLRATASVAMASRPPLNPGSPNDRFQQREVRLPGQPAEVSEETASCEWLLPGKRQARAAAPPQGRFEANPGN